MKPQIPPAPTHRQRQPRRRALAFAIDPADVEAMLDDYDSGMADRRTANALSRAVQRRLGLGRTPRLIRNHTGHAELHLDDQIVVIPPAEALAFLERAERGADGGPFQFELEIAETALAAVGAAAVPRSPIDATAAFPVVPLAS